MAKLPTYFSLCVLTRVRSYPSTHDMGTAKAAAGAFGAAAAHVKKGVFQILAAKAAKI